MHYKTVSILCTLLVSIISGACSEQSNSPNNQTKQESMQLANPASENCIKHGGKISIEKRGDGGEYGVCLFEDNRQCEEWAMLRDDCPVGGIKVTGYVTPAACYCAITGGEYTVTANSNMEDDTSLNVSASAFGVTPGPAFSPSTLNHDALNVSQNNQRRDDLIKGNHPLQLGTTDKQEQPTAATESDMQQSLIKLADQATLTEPSKQILRSWDDVKGKNGISIHGPCCHGPRVLLLVERRAQQTGPKVTQLADVLTGANISF